MLLKRTDIQLGELLIADYDVYSMNIKKVQKGWLYIVADLNGYEFNGIWIICVKTGVKLHSNARYFLKSDNFCP